MPFPDAEHAVVAQEKVCDYLLNLAHPVGGSKAAWFHSLGYSFEDWQLLAEHLRRVAISSEKFVAKPSDFGVKYVTFGKIGVSPHSSGDVVAVWVVEANLTPRLVTAYPA